MITRIIVTLDGSLTAEQAIPAAVGLARRLHAELLLLHVLDYRSPDYAADRRQEFYENTRDCAVRYLEAAAEAAQKRWLLPIQCALVEGDAVSNILEQSGHRKADLLVMTSHGRGHFGRFWLGSVTDAVIRRSAVPVLVVRAVELGTEFRGDEPFQHILVPLDGSEAAEQVLNLADEIAQADGSELTLLQVAPPALVSAMPGYDGFVGVGPTVDEATAHDYLRRVRGAQNLHAAQLDTVVLTNGLTVANDIVRYAHQKDVDLLAITTHGHGGLRRLILGGIADKIIRSAHCPVLVCNARVTEMGGDHHPPPNSHVQA